MGVCHYCGKHVDTGVSPDCEGSGMVSCGCISRGATFINMKALDKQEGGNHYKLLKIQPIEYITANRLNFAEGNIIKYISRHREKNGMEDLRKARHMLELLAELEYGEKL